EHNQSKKGDNGDKTSSVSFAATFPKGEGLGKIFILVFYMNFHRTHIKIRNLKARPSGEL
ncbi:MAG: hypothetical protein IJ489_11695, partial [Clostridia bacterium]|nr:hypothetical protein [Clostridia bacterium]